MRIAAVQFEPKRGPSSDNFPRLLPLIDRAATDRDLAVAPEMAFTGYLFPDAAAARRVAEPATGPTFEALSPIAKAHRCWIVAGFAEDAGERLYNSAMVLDREGNLAFVYRKTLLYEPDHRWCAPGDSGYASFDTGEGTFGVGICMDLNDPAFVAWTATSAVHAIAFPTNWVHDTLDVHDYWRARLNGTGAVLVAANRWGSEDDVTFAGRSAIVSRDRVWAAAPRTGDGVLTGALRLT